MSKLSKKNEILIANFFLFRSCISTNNPGDFSHGKFSRTEDVSSNLDAGLISKELAERLGQIELKNEPTHGEYELVDIRQQQIIGNLTTSFSFVCFGKVD